MTTADELFTYRPPNDETAPKYAAIRAAEKLAHDACEQVIGGEKWHYDKAAAHAAINDATKALYLAIEENAPPSADRSAALRCVVIARMAANEAVVLNQTWRDEPASQCRDNLRAARWQACAAIAMSQPLPAVLPEP